MSNWRREIEVDPDWQDYHIHLTDGWVEDVCDSMSSRSRLQAVLLDLVLDLRAASYTASLPYLLTTNIVGFHGGHIRAGDDRSHTVLVADTLLQKLAPALRDRLSFGPVQMAIAEDICKTLQKELGSTVDRLSRPISHDKVWSGFADDKTFKLMAWAAQRNAFVMSWAALENFLLQAVAEALMKPNFKRKLGQERFADLADKFGEDVHSLCWSADYPTCVRLARDTILHNGGRMGSPLDQLPHPFEVVDKRLLIKARHVTELLLYIEKCAEAVIAAGKDIRELLREKKKRRKRGKR